jgi:5-formaminoimidazole-4-carboxamide-1-(beta)-D-ribofuranosyl 5'-monophosphate synthetase
VINERVKSALDSYNRKQITIGTICSHSALQILYGGRIEGFKTVGIIKPDRRPVYDAYPAARPDDFIEIEDWSEILDEKVQEELIARNTIIVPHGSFVEYVGPSNITKRFNVPILGNRCTLEWEGDRDKQRQWLQKAGVRVPRQFNSPDDIDRKVFIKFPGAKGGKGFFTASTKSEYFKNLKERIKVGLIKEEDAEHATIQEFLPGVRYYPHYFFSPLKNSIGYHIKNGVLTHMGFDKRIEPVDEAYRALPDVPPEFMDYSITGNQAVTLRESLLPHVLTMGKGTVEASQELMPPGMVGPFSLETFYHPFTGFTVFEISARIVAGTNPFGQGSEYSIWTYGEPVSTGRRIAMEIKAAIKEGELEKIVS